MNTEHQLKSKLTRPKCNCLKLLFSVGDWLLVVGEGGNKNLMGGGGGVYWGRNFSSWGGGDEKIFGCWGRGASPHPPSRENPGD